MPKKKTKEASKLSTKVYYHVEEENAEYAKEYGKNLFGSASAYINALIANDRGAKPTLGAWKSPGEAKAVRTGHVKIIPDLEIGADYEVDPVI